MLDRGRQGQVCVGDSDGAVLRVGVGDSAHNVYDGGNSDDEFAHLNGFNEEVFRMMDSGRRGNVQEVTPDGAVLRVGVGDPAHNVYDDDEFADLNGYNEEVFRMMDSGRRGNVQAESAAAGDFFKDEDICKQLFVLPTPGTSSDDESIIEE